MINLANTVQKKNTLSSLLQGQQHRSTLWLVDNLKACSPLAEPNSYLLFPKFIAYSLLGIVAVQANRSQMLASPNLHVACDFMAEITHHPDMLRQINRNPNFIEFYLLGLLALRRGGYEMPDYRDFVAARVQHGYALVTERPAYRTLFLAALLNEFEFTHTLPSITTLYQRTLPSFRPSPIFIKANDVQDIYRISFALHLAHGAALPQIAAVDYPELAALLPVLMGIYMRGGRPATVARLVQACRWLGVGSAEVEKAAFIQLVSAELPVTPFKSALPHHSALLTTLLDNRFNAVLRQ